MNLNEYFDMLAGDNSRLFKLEKLREHADNELLKKVIVLALDPFTQFYQRKIPKYVTSRPVWHTLESALPKLDKLSKREVTGNAAVQYLSLLLSEVSPDDAKVIERIIGKDLKCGVSVSTVNAVWPDLIHEYPCMLCSQFEQKLVDKITFPAFVQLKMDGMRFNAIVRHEGLAPTCEFRSRNGKELNLRGHLEKEFIALSGGKDIVFDGELMVMLDGDYQFTDRQTGNGILNKANKGTISEKEAAMVHASLWDMIPLEDFKIGVCKTPYTTRWAALEAMVKAMGSKDKRIWLVASDIVKTQEEANAIFQDYLEKGLEGIILKDGRSIWENKRSKSQIKFKGELECDLKVVGYQMGTGKYEGLVGAILCESSDGVIKVDVGSGFKDFQRLDFTNDSIIGKIVAVKYNARIKNKQGEESLFLPIFIEVRNDKDVADSSKDIK